MNLITSGKCFELRIIGELPPGVAPEQVPNILLASISFVGTILPHIRASFVDVHDEHHSVVMERIHTKIAAKKKPVGM